MGKEQVMGIIRHILTFAGGWAVAQGWLDETSMVEAVGAVATLVGVMWSFLAPEKKAVTDQTAG